MSSSPPGHCQSPEHADQLRRRAAAQEEFLRLRGRTVSGVQVVGNGTSGFIIAYGGGVAVHQQGVGVIQNRPDGLVDFRRRGNGGVAQRIVVDVFRPHNGGLPTAILE